MFFKYLFLSLFFPNSRKRLEYKLFRLLNKERKREGLAKLFFQNDLRRVARKHSSDMARKDYFAHDNLQGKTPKDRFQDSKVSDAVAGENLAKVGGFKNPVLVAHNGLMDSPGHRANILSKSYNCVGIGLSISDTKVHYYTQNFSYRLLALKSYPTSVRFSKKVNIKGKVIDTDAIILLFRVKDFYDEVVFEDQIKLKDTRKFRFVFHFPKNQTYQFEIYAGKQSLRLSNHFEIVKKSWL